MSIEVVNLADKFKQFKSAWDPKIVGRLNGQMLKLARFKGDFVRHHHEEEDELFLVVEGEIEIEFDDQNLRVAAGEFVIVPRGTPHRPRAEEEALVMLFEPESTRNTGEEENNLTRNDLEEL